MLNHEVRTLACAVPAERPKNGPTIVYRSLPFGFSQLPVGVLPQVGGAQSDGRHRPDGLLIGSVLATILDLSLRAEGVSRAEMQAATGWARATSCARALQMAADKANVALQSERSADGTVRYFGQYQAT